MPEIHIFRSAFSPFPLRAYVVAVGLHPFPLTDATSEVRRAVLRRAPWLGGYL